LTLPLLVLVGVVNTHPAAIVVLSVGLAAHALLCLLISLSMTREVGYLQLTGLFLLIGIM
jgi:hypothetical protein